MLFIMFPDVERNWRSRPHAEDWGRTYLGGNV